MGPSENTSGANEGPDTASGFISVRDAKEIRPDKSLIMVPVLKPAPMTGLQTAGVRLAIMVLAMMSVIIVALLVMVAIDEFWHPTQEVASMQRLVELAEFQSRSASSPESIARANEVLGKLNEARRETRAYWVGLGQFLLLNLLLPVLTSILGYIFGTIHGPQKNLDDS